MSLLPHQLLESPLPGIGRPLTPREADLTSKYLNILTKWHNTHRLVGSADPAWLIQNVFLDSLCFLGALPSELARVADIGSGAGVPGIPLAIVRPDVSFTLIEARRRRASFLSTVVRELELTGVDVVADRVEHLGTEYDERFDAVVMRCAAGMGAILEPALRLTRPGGVVIASSNPVALEEAGAEVVTVRNSPAGFRTFRRFVRQEFER